MHQSVWIPRGQPRDSDSFLTSHQGGYDNGVQTQGLPVLPFKVMKLLLPGVINRGDFDTKGTNVGGDFGRRNVQMSESPGYVHGRGGTLVIHNVWYIRCFCYLQSPHSTANKTCMFPRQKSTQVDQQADQQAKRTLNKRKLVFMFYPDTNNCFNEDM